jgi:hypothetical protein
MANSTEVSVREADGIVNIARVAENEESYNRLYAQALPIARTGDEDTLQLFFDAIRAEFDDAEKAYNYALAENMPDAPQKGVKMQETLADYQAGLDV